MNSTKTDTLSTAVKRGHLACQAAVPLLCKSGRGRIVNIGSDASSMGWPLVSHYVAAKFGVVGLTKSLAGELAEHQVAVNCVCPIATATTGIGQKCLRWKMDAREGTEEEVHRATAAAVPLKRNSTEADVVSFVDCSPIKTPPHEVSPANTISRMRPSLRQC